PEDLPALDQLVELDILDKHFQTALDRVRPHVEKNPKAPDLRFLQAKIYVAQSDTAQAEKVLLQTIQIDPSFRQAYMLLAQIYVGSNKYEQALDNLQKILSRNPKDVGALMQVGMIHERLGKFSEAGEAYEKLLSVNPQFGLAINNLAYLYA